MSLLTPLACGCGGGGSEPQAASGPTDSGALQLTTSSLPAGTVGTPYTASLAASGGSLPYQWSITAGTLPVGLNLSAASGAISGTPSSAGRSNFTVQVQDANEQSALAKLSIAISATTSLSVTTSWLPKGVVGTPYSGLLTVLGGTPLYQWTISSGALPAGLSLNAGVGSISGAHKYTLVSPYPSNQGCCPYVQKIGAPLAGVSVTRLNLNATANTGSSAEALEMDYVVDSEIGFVTVSGSEQELVEAQ